MNFTQGLFLFLAIVLLPLGSFADPGSEATLDAESPGPVSVVIVPPAGPEALLVLSDRLAEEMGRNESLRVVDRTQIERILAEKVTAGDSVKPVQSFDLMLRLRILPASTPPRLALELIDLSTGSVCGAKESPWSEQIDQRQVAEMAEFCQTVAAEVARGRQRRLRVRLLGIGNPEHRLRLQPMADQLASIVEAVADRSPRCRMVQHLEALTAKEESLLLYAGLGRIPGGREFVPQADVTLEGTLRETDIVGKTFDETPLEISWWLASRGRPPGEPVTLTATVGEWPSLARQFGERLATQLGETSPVPFGDTAVEMVHRRQQAEAEIAAARKGLEAIWAGGSAAFGGQLTTSEGSFKVHPAYARLAVAAKLDPTCEEAAYLLARHSATGTYRERSPQSDAWAMKECLNYLTRFRGDPKHRREVYSSGIFVANNYFLDLRHGANASSSLSPQRAEMLTVLQQILGTLPIRAQDWSERGMTCMGVNLVCNGLVAMRLPRAERDPWLVDFVARYESKVGADQIELKVLQLRSAINDEDMVAAKSLAETLLARRPRPVNTRGWQANPWRPVHAEFVRLNDAELLARLKSWIVAQSAEIKDKTAAEAIRQWLKHAFPDPVPARPPATGPVRSLPAEAPNTGPSPNWREMIEYLDLRDRNLRNATPLIVNDRTLYLVQRGGWSFIPGQSVSTPPPKGLLLRVSLDAAGRAVGKPEPLPESPQAFNLAGFAAAGSRVYFSLLGEGLREFDSTTGKWRSWGVAQGLPTASIHGLFVMDDKTLLLTGTGGHYSDGFLSTLNVDSGEVKVLLREPHWSNMPRLESLWRNGDTYLSITGDGRILDGLSGRLVRRVPVKPQYWDPFNNVVRMAAFGGRRWVGLDGLYEVNEQGEVTCSYLGQALRPPGLNLVCPVSIEIDQRSLKLAHDGTHLYLVTDGKVACYNPATDQWYGAMQPGASLGHVVSAPGGIWVGASNGPAFIDTARFVAMAEARGLTGKSRGVETQNP
ncbi:MAG: hypothetical protein JXL80_10860 [Planctomycetes bacterium]|nr:hypothetical protein [Planctomycetota bacterium]